MSSSTQEASQRSLPAGLLQGYDSYTGDGRSTVLTAAEEGGVERHGGESSVRYRVCEGTQQLIQELEINQSLTIGLFGNMFSLSQKMQFVERQETTSHSLCIVVFAKHTEGTETATDVALSPHVSPPQGSEELKEFHMVYGDSYVVSRTTGGEYMAVYTYHCDTAEEQQEVSASMEAGGIFKAFVGDVGLQASINNFRSTQSTRISFDQLLTGIRQVEGGLPDPDNVIDFALNFPSLPLTAPVITQLKTRGYERVPEIGSRFNGIARNIRLLTQQSFIDGLIRVRDLRKQVHSVAGAYSLYAPAVGAADGKLQEVVALVDADGRAIEAMVEGFEEDPSRPVHLELASVERGRHIGEPMIGFYERKHAIGEAPSSGFGYTRVQEFDDMDGDVYRFLQQRARITAFSFLNATADDAPVSMRLRFRNGQGRSWTVVHGAAAPAPPPIENSAELQVPEGDFLASIRTFQLLGMQAADRRYIIQFFVDLSNRANLTHRGSRTSPPPANTWLGTVTPLRYYFLGFQGTSIQHTTPSPELWAPYLHLVFASLTSVIWR